MKILGIISTRIQLLLHRFPLHLGKTNTTWVLPLDLSIYCFWSVLHLPNTQKRINIDTYFCLRPLDRLIIGYYRSRPRKWWILHAFHIQNFFRMFHYKLLSNVEYTRNIVGFCVFLYISRFAKQFGPRWMAAFIDEVISIPISTHSFRMLPWRMLRQSRTFPISSAKTERSCSCTDGSSIPCFSILVLTRNILVSTRLRISDFWMLHQLPGCLYDFLYFIGIHRIDQRPQTSWRDFLTSLLAQHQAWCRFRRRRAFIRSRLLTSFRHGALLSNLIVSKKITEISTRIHREIHNVEQTKEGDSTHLLRNYHWPESQQVVFFGVNMFDLDFGFQIDSVKSPIKSNSVSSGNMSHCRASSLNDHLDHRFVAFKHIQPSFLTRRIDVWGNKINFVQIIGNEKMFWANNSWALSQGCGTKNECNVMCWHNVLICTFCVRRVTVHTLSMQQPEQEFKLSESLLATSPPVLMIYTKKYNCPVQVEDRQ